MWRGVWLGACAFIAAGCVASSSVTCDDGRACPSGTVCVADPRLCATPEQLASCDGLPDQSACAYRGEPKDGICFSGACILRGCGNGELEGDEVCDDGNIVHGDGCAADCASDERCGNGIVDVAIGEACDDGNTVDGDGCLATCALPSCGDGVLDPQFSEQCDDGPANAKTPDACRPGCLLPRCGDGITDVAHGEKCDDHNLVADDGCNADCTSDETCGNGVIDYVAGEACDDKSLIDHDGCTSTCGLETPAQVPLGIVRPQGRHGHALAYDPNRARVVMFGGESETATGVLADTAQWNGGNWVTINSTLAPSARQGHRMAFDSEGALVLFGGLAAGGRQTDTWLLVGEQWQPLTLPTTPAARAFHAMAYDAGRKRIVMFGGDGATGLLADTWEWDGASWIQRSPGASPPPRAHAGMAYDPIRGEVILYGGEDAGGTALADTWRYAGTTWIQATSTGAPARTRHAMTFDAGRGVIASVGGLDGAGARSAQTWEWNGTTWVQRSVTGPGDPRDEHAIAYSIAAQRIVLFGGEITTPARDSLPVPGRADTWELAGASAGWQEMTPTYPAPTYPAYSTVAYNSARDELTAFGLIGTWVQTSRGWMKPVTQHAPAARNQAAMAYDSIRGVTVMFGGTGAGNEVWELDGLDWSQHSAIGSVWPTTRYDHRMAFDPTRGRVVMFGGASVLNQTWEWDGTSWTVSTPSGSPTVRKTPGLSYAGSGTILMFGGDTGSAGLADTWLWNGSTWTQQFPSTVPPVAKAPFIAWDSDRSVAVMTAPSGTWEWSGTDWSQRDTAPRSGLFSFVASRHASIELTSGSIESAWNGTTWSIVPASTDPGASTTPGGPSLVYDPSRGRVVGVGGSRGINGSGETWEWNGNRWIDRTPASPPPGRIGAAVAYDTKRNQALMFGGAVNQTFNPPLLGDTWIWHSASGTWTQPTTSASPSARTGSGLAYDRARDRVVLFGGVDSSSTLYADTWEWDGSDWALKSPAMSPSARADHRLVYDLKHQRIVLFGGRNASGNTFDDTWTWDGSTWTKLTPSAVPPSRKGFGLAYDPLRERVVLTGGRMDYDSIDEIWELDGDVWKQTLGTLTSACTVYDDARAMLFDGFNGWQWNAIGAPACNGPDPDRDMLAGCADPDCWSVCTPYCPPGTTCDPSAPHCGDATCSALESIATCAADCGAAVAQCGDAGCTGGETHATCPGDCP